MMLTVEVFRFEWLALTDVNAEWQGVTACRGTVCNYHVADWTVPRDAMSTLIAIGSESKVITSIMN